MSGGGKSARPQLVGYGYYVGFAYAFCGISETLLEILRDDDVIWPLPSWSYYWSSPAPAPITNGQSAYAEYGEKGDPHSSNGSAVGRAVFYSGIQTTADPYLGPKTDNELAYTGTTYMSFHQPFVGDNAQALPNIEVILNRLTIGTPVGFEIIGTRDVNPCAVIYYMLTSLLQVPADKVDLPAFQEAAEVCYNEGRGISITISRAKTLIDWINLILNHVDGVLVVDAFTSQYRIKLMRDDYDKDNLPTIHEEDCSKLELVRKTWLDIYSSFIFKYNDHNKKYRENSVEYRNSAAIRQLGQDRAKNMSFPLFTSAEAMQPSVEAYMRNNSYPLATIKLTTSLIDFPNVLAGDVFILEAPSLSISSMVCRVSEVGGDREGQINVEIKASEDIFGLTVNIPPVSEVPIGSGIDYSVGPIEYADIKATSRESAQYPSITPVFVAPEGYSTTKFLSPDGTSVVVAPWVLGTLVQDYIPTWNKGELTQGQPVLLKNVSGLFEVSATPDSFSRLQFSGYIGDEAIGFGSLVQVDADEDLWELDDIVHNIAGTPENSKATIIAGTRVWITSTPARDIINVEVEPNEVDTITYHLQSSNSKTYNDPFPISYRYTGTANRPYPASELQVQGSEVLWTPNYPLSGANYRSASNIVGGEDEGLAYGAEGYYEVYEVTSTGSIIQQLATVPSGLAELPYRYTHSLAAGKYIGVLAVGTSGKTSIMKYERIV